MKLDIFKYGIKNEFIPKTSWYNVKRIISKKISLKIFNLLLLAVAILIFGMILTPINSPVEECPECETCKTCPIIEETPCPTVEPKKELKIVNTYVCADGSVVGDPIECDGIAEKMQKYVCKDGSVMDTAEECKETVEITTEYQETDNQLTLAIDDIDYEMKGEDWGTITQISYTVLNLGDKSILPKIQIKVYNESDSVTLKTENRHTIKINQTLENEEFSQAIENVYISFKGLNITIKFILLDGLEEFSQAKVILERPLN